MVEFVFRVGNQRYGPSIFNGDEGLWVIGEEVIGQRVG